MTSTRLFIREARPTVIISASGPQGATGAGIKVLGELASTANLPVSADEPGDAYIIGSALYVFTASGQWAEQAFLEGGEGPMGPQGPQGIQGPQGETGPEGPQGPTGPVGPKGDKGDRGTGIAIKGALANDTLLPVTPAAPEDAYIINGDLYVWDGDEWVNVGPFRGPEGPQGPQGVKGDQGAQGVQGPKGDTGAEGPQGPIGPTGPKGDKGDTGDVGPQGPKGDKGDPGDDGAPGAAGTNGKTIINAAYNAQGALTTFTGTQRSYAAAAGTITNIRCALGTAGAGTTTVVVKKNGTAAATINIPSGWSVEVSTTPIAMAQYDYLTVDVTAVGTGAKDLVVAIRMEES